MKQRNLEGEPRPYLIEYSHRLREIYMNRKEWLYHYKQLNRLRIAQNRAYRYLADDKPFLFYLFFILNLPLDIWRSLKSINDYYLLRNQISKEEDRYSPRFFKKCNSKRLK